MLVPGVQHGDSIFLYITKRSPFLGSILKSNLNYVSLIHTKERLGAGEGGDRWWNGWMVSPTQWTWVWASSSRLWRTGKPGALQYVGSKESDTIEWLNNDNKVKEPDPTWSQVSLFPVTALLLSAHKGGIKQTDWQRSQAMQSADLERQLHVGTLFRSSWRSS